MADSQNPFMDYDVDAEKPISAKKEKRYFWLKLMDGFFDDKSIKLLRAQENGDKMVIVYLLLQLKALKSEGIINYLSIMPSIEEEIAVDIGENVDLVKKTVEFLVKLNLVEVLDDSALYMITKKELLDYGSESASAERVRRHREKKQNR